MDDFNNVNEIPEQAVPEKPNTNADKWWSEPDYERQSCEYSSQPTCTAYVSQPQYAPTTPAQPTTTQTPYNQSYVQYGPPVIPVNQQKRSCGMAIAALVVGAVGLLMSFIPIVGYALPALAAIFGLIALTDRRGTVMAVIAVVLAVISILLCSFTTFTALCEEFENSNTYYEDFDYEDDRNFGYDGFI